MAKEADRRWLDQVLPAAEQERVVAAVRAAEGRTSGEVKVHLEERCPGDPFARGRELFERLGLTATKERNGVLLYVAVGDRKYAILGDAGIHAAVGGDAFWSDTGTRMRACFARGALAEGLVGAVAEIGERLAARFPHRADDVNELSDDISTGEPPPR